MTAGGKVTAAVSVSQSDDGRSAFVHSQNFLIFTVHNRWRVPWTVLRGYAAFAAFVASRTAVPRHIKKNPLNKGIHHVHLGKRYN